MAKKSVDEIEKKIEQLKQEKKELKKKRNEYAGNIFFLTFPEMINESLEDVKAFIELLGEKNADNRRD